MTSLIVEAPRKLEPLLHPARYKAAYGGRGGGKSHFFAEEIVLRCIERETHVACIREIQGSLDKSVRKLILDKIKKFGVEHMFNAVDSEIRGPHGSIIIFRGMQDHTAESIKSLEGMDIAWVEEAQTLSDYSLRLLRPTIRKQNSEIWFSWNPRFETDAVDDFFRGNSPHRAGKAWRRPKDCVVVEVNWYDNPWLSSDLIEEKDNDYYNDQEMAEHVWGGSYEKVGTGAYYAKHISKLEREGRIGSFPYNPDFGGVFTSWDIGVNDFSAIWFFQVHYTVGMPRVRVIDYYESQNIGVQDIIPAAMPELTHDASARRDAMIEMGRDTPYTYQRHFLPHDIKVREWGAGARERIHTLVELGIRADSINVGVQTNPENRINAVREMLPMCEFDNNSRVLVGLSRLRRYTKRFNKNLGTYEGPLKDGNDHGADSFGEFAINAGISMPPPPKDNKPKKGYDDGYMVIGDIAPARR